jgi:hypothetical protein
VFALWSRTVETRILRGDERLNPLKVRLLAAGASALFVAVLVVLAANQDATWQWALVGALGLAWCIAAGEVLKDHTPPPPQPRPAPPRHLQLADGEALAPGTEIAYRVKDHWRHARVVEPAGSSGSPVIDTATMLGTFSRLFARGVLIGDAHLHTIELLDEMPSGAAGPEPGERLAVTGTADLVQWDEYQHWLTADELWRRERSRDG